MATQPQPGYPAPDRAEADDCAPEDGRGPEDGRAGQIAAAAYDLLDEHGLEGLTIRAVLGKTGLARRAFMPNTRIFNLTGQPAMSVPLGWGEDGLPIGLQFVGRMGDEATLFRLAGQLEQARPWVGRRPTGVSFTNLDVAGVERPLGA